MNLWYLGLGWFSVFLVSSEKWCCTAERIQLCQFILLLVSCEFVLQSWEKWEGSLCFPAPQCGTRQTAHAVCMLGRDVQRTLLPIFVAGSGSLTSENLISFLEPRIQKMFLWSKSSSAANGQNGSTLNAVHPWEDQVQFLWSVHL